MAAGKASSGSADSGFSTEEKKAMRDAVYERKRKGKTTPEEDAKACLDAINGMDEPDRSTALRLHQLLLAAAPDATTRTWYGMPAYAKNGKVICFFQNASKFKTRYSTLGFTDSARLDDGDFWPAAYALNRLTPEIEGEITQLAKRAFD